MKKIKVLAVGLLLTFGFVSYGFDTTVVCPGNGEKCEGTVYDSEGNVKMVIKKSHKGKDRGFLEIKE